MLNSHTVNDLVKILLKLFTTTNNVNIDLVGKSVDNLKKIKIAQTYKNLILK